MTPYELALHAAAERFAPLRSALVAHGVPDEDIFVDQTGGMIMCLRVVLEQGDTKYKQEFVLFSDPDDMPEDEAQFGAYNELDGKRDDGTMFYNPDITYDQLEAMGTWAAAWILAAKEGRQR